MAQVPIALFPLPLSSAYGQAIVWVHFSISQGFLAKVAFWAPSRLASPAAAVLT